MAKTYEQINEKIKNGEAVVVTAEEVIDIIREKGTKEAAEYVDVVTTATFGPMCSSGAFLNFGHASPPIRMQKTYLNQVESYSGIAAVDTYIGATEWSKDRGYEYGGAHVICDLIDGKPVTLEATANPSDCYPRKEIKTEITLDDLNEAYLFNPRNAYQNYNAATNSSNQMVKTYMGVLKPEYGNVTYCTSGALSPLLNDPTYRTIGIGTRIFLAGAQGYVSWRGTQFNSSAERDENGVPIKPAGTLAVIGDLKDMDTQYISPAVFEGYGVSLFLGIGIPIPILDEDMMKSVGITNEDITTNVVDYGLADGNKAVVRSVNYEELRSGKIQINGKMVKTASITSLKKSREIAALLKSQIQKGAFYLQKPVEMLPTTGIVKGLKIK
ncbi:homocysteine biosynthesis protein [Fusibacter ferrireducens]|uniref:Homocysteine biosynthesis protein n=1 Tax=Fusibacter ferrireducens TaxID=2785058 RepID=A0ABR9ZTK8_9FIRM|nr:homocysteine biosynthesis protein [Fusibacter ferrireducens]MBF4693785.1 homocysteine biosynthesis protein [Fusibacter ferrireducens]